MLRPNEFWLQLHRLVEAYEAEGPTKDQRAERIGAQLREMPAIAQRALLNDLMLVAADIPDLYPLVAAELNGSRSRHDDLHCYLDDAIAITAADMGNIQFLDRDGSLRIAVHRGFKEPFLQFFQCVQGGHCACGTTLKQRKRTIIDDVTKSPVFTGTPALEVMLAAGARAVQSTPLIDDAGQFVGVLSTHFKRPHRPTDLALLKLDRLAQRAAAALSRVRAE